MNSLRQSNKSLSEQFAETCTISLSDCDCTRTVTTEIGQNFDQFSNTLRYYSAKRMKSYNIHSLLIGCWDPYISRPWLNFFRRYIQKDPSPIIWDDVIPPGAKYSAISPETIISDFRYDMAVLSKTQQFLFSKSKIIPPSILVLQNTFSIIARLGESLGVDIPALYISPNRHPSAPIANNGDCKDVASLIQSALPFRANDYPLIKVRELVAPFISLEKDKASGQPHLIGTYDDPQGDKYPLMFLNQKSKPDNASESFVRQIVDGIFDNAGKGFYETHQQHRNCLLDWRSGRFKEKFEYEIIVTLSRDLMKAKNAARYMVELCNEVSLLQKIKIALPIELENHIITALDSAHQYFVMSSHRLYRAALQLCLQLEYDIAQMQLEKGTCRKDKYTPGLKADTFHNPDFKKRIMIRRTEYSGKIPYFKDFLGTHFDTSCIERFHTLDLKNKMEFVFKSAADTEVNGFYKSSLMNTVSSVCKTNFSDYRKAVISSIAETIERLNIAVNVSEKKSFFSKITALLPAKTIKAIERHRSMREERYRTQIQLLRQAFNQKYNVKLSNNHFSMRILSGTDLRVFFKEADPITLGLFGARTHLREILSLSTLPQ